MLDAGPGTGGGRARDAVRVRALSRRATVTTDACAVHSATVTTAHPRTGGGCVLVAAIHTIRIPRHASEQPARAAARSPSAAGRSIVWLRSLNSLGRFSACAGGGRWAALPAKHAVASRQLPVDARRDVGSGRVGSVCVIRVAGDRALGRARQRRRPPAQPVSAARAAPQPAYGATNVLAARTRRRRRQELTRPASSDLYNSLLMHRLSLFFFASSLPIYQ